jgi:putative NAD(P)-binding protein
MKIFIAGATGAVGMPLVRVLCALGHQVTGMTSAGAGVDRLRELGAEPSCADAFDAGAVRSAIKAASPDVVIDQLTWLPANPADIIRSMPDDTRLHREGGGILLSAAQDLGVSRYIVQSRGFTSMRRRDNSPTRQRGSGTTRPARSVKARERSASMRTRCLPPGHSTGLSCATASSTAPAPGIGRTAPLRIRCARAKQ